MTIASNLRVPFIAVEIDPSKAVSSSAQLKYKVLVIGQKLAAGAAVSGNITRAIKGEEALQFGRGSFLYSMMKTWFLNNEYTEVYVLPFNDQVGWVAASYSTTFTVTATGNGILSWRIGDEYYQIAITTGQTPTQQAAAMKAAIDANLDSLVTVSVVAGAITFTCKCKGLNGNELVLELLPNSEDVSPPGLALTNFSAAFTSGAGEPDTDDIFAAIENIWFNAFVNPYWTTPATITAWETELANRFGPLVMREGVMFTALFASGNTKSSKLTYLTNIGIARNSPHVSGIAWAFGKSLTALAATAYAACITREAEIDPSMPFSHLELRGIVGPLASECFNMSERNSLLYSGVSTLYIDNSGICRIDRAITQYQRNSGGATDTAYLDVTTMFTLMYLRYDFRTTIQNKYPRAKLANDGVNFKSGMQVITPKIGKAEAIAIFRRWEYAGLVENFDQFKNDIICERDANDPNRLNWTINPDLINQFIVGGVTIQFLLQGPSSSSSIA